ncbi:MAG: hypothetical protein K2G37_02390, partial [Clostridia bacterium]|nr:hypothetical protein [Clostridia bacterium]
VAVFILGAVLSCVPFDFTLYSAKEEIGVTNTAYSITTNTSDGLGEFNDGASYIYTDKNKVNDYRAGNIDTDMTPQTVNKTKDRGTIENPYVIASEDDWDRFAKNLDDGSIANYGSGAYFVLINDLDFSNRTFHPVRFFNGTFLGMGHTLSNITLNGAEWQYWNAAANDYAQIPTSGAASPLGYGVFCQVSGAVISDLIVADFNYTNMVMTTATYHGGANTGGIVGNAFGNDYLLNCHTLGAISADNRYSGSMSAGGIVGQSINDITLYRCSAEVNITIEVSTYLTAAGIIGGVGYTTANATIYDCVTNATIKMLTCTNHSCSAAIIGIYGGSGAMDIQDVIYTFDLTTQMRNAGGGMVGIFGGNKFTFVNCYMDAKMGDASKLSMYSVCGSTALTSSNSTVSNVNQVCSTATYAPVFRNDYTERLSSVAGSELHEWKGSAASDDMVAAATEFFASKPYSNIWDTSKIGGSYTPDESPVRNYLLAFVSYRNLEGGGATEVAIPLKDGKTDGDGFVVGDTLYVPTDEYIASKLAANHEFLGWTDDKDGDSEPFYELPSGFYGDVTLFAV